MTVHPSYLRFHEDWRLLRTSYEGERAVKTASELYLPATDGMRLKGMKTVEAEGYQLYDAYRKRAVFPPLITESIRQKLGILNGGPAKIELPARLEPMRETATLEGESLQMLIERIHEQVLLTGRIGLLGDVPDNLGPTAMPRIVSYDAPAIINWDDGRREDGVQALKLMVLDESEYIRQPLQLTWTWQQKHRVLVLGPIGDLDRPVYGTALIVDQSAGTLPGSYQVPQIGGRALDRIPFVVINPTDLCLEPDVPPLLALGNLGMTIYRGSADYRHALFMQAQETLAVIGQGPPSDGSRPIIGAGGIIFVDNPQGDVKYVGVSAAGLSEMRMREENDYKIAAELGAQVLERTTNQAEARDTLRIRVASRMASLGSIADVSAAGLQDLLQMLALWVGANPEDVKVEPNKEFMHATDFGGQEALQWQQAKNLGFPVSSQTLHKVAAKANVTDLTWDQEMEEIDKERMDEVGGDASLDLDPE